MKQAERILFSTGTAIGLSTAIACVWVLNTQSDYTEKGNQIGVGLMGFFCAVLGCVFLYKLVKSLN